MQCHCHTDPHSLYFYFLLLWKILTNILTNTHLNQFQCIFGYQYKYDQLLCYESATDDGLRTGPHEFIWPSEWPPIPTHMTPITKMSSNSYKFHFSISACNLPCHKTHTCAHILAMKVETHRFTFCICIYLYFSAQWPKAYSPTIRTWYYSSTWLSCFYVSWWKATGSYKLCQWICLAIMVSWL